MSTIPGDLLSLALTSKAALAQLQSEERWPTFEEILQGLHAQGIYIHSEQLAEFLLAHGLPVHLRYVPAHLRQTAIEVNENYQGDMVRVVEEPEPPCWDFSWMDSMQQPSFQDNQVNYICIKEEIDQPSWDYF